MSVKVEEGNEIISRFLAKLDGRPIYSNEGDFISDDINGGDAESTFYKWGGMKFHRSLDWIVYIVDKIREMGNRIEIISTPICYSAVLFNDNSATGKLYISSYSKLIDCLFTMCVQFIQWYNTQTNTQ